MFTLHNETVNMWTHLLGSLYAVGMGVHLASSLDYENYGVIEAEALWVLALAFTTAVCLLASFSYHLCTCTGERVCDCMHRMDQTGIVALIIASYFSGIALFYRCFPRLRLFYLCFAGCVAVALTTPFVFPSLVSNIPRHLIMCVSAAVVPAAHIMCIAPKHELVMVFFYVIPMMACYGVGAWIFVAKWPECWWPGRFDIFGHSHQIWHLLVLCAAITWIHGNVVVLTSLECDGPEAAPAPPR
jgi:adiponectin receptor